MQRDRNIRYRVVSRLLALAMTLVVGLHFGPVVSTHRAATSAICAAEKKASEDTLKIGERLEPRVFPAPFIDRLSPLPPFCHSGAGNGTGEAMAFGASATDASFGGVRLPIVKHVPRMERGDPPRV